MKPISILITGLSDLVDINEIRKESSTSEEALLLLSIYKETGDVLEALEAKSSTPIGTDTMFRLAGMEVLTINGWQTVLTCTELCNGILSVEWIITLSGNPKKAYRVDKNGYSSLFRIYGVREAKKTKAKTIKQRQAEEAQDQTAKLVESWKHEQTKTDAVKAAARKTGTLVIDIPLKDEPDFLESAFPLGDKK